ncbi:MAG: hypothetical protein OJF48_004508 [Afipia sp.]|nr:MAG: hypothetical protein OJF48_004508 [Afipia sp.]
MGVIHTIIRGCGKAGRSIRSTAGAAEDELGRWLKGFLDRLGYPD